MIIVESVEEFHNFLINFKSVPSIVIPILSDVSAHPLVNEVSLLYVRFLSDEVYLLPFAQSEAINLPKILQSNLVTNQVVYTPSKKVLTQLIHTLDVTVVDLKGLEYFVNGDCLDETRLFTLYMRNMYSKFHELKDLNKILPLMQLVKFCEDYSKYISKFITLVDINERGFKFHNDIVVPACAFMERNGVHVDPDLFVEHYGARSKKFIIDNLVFTEYNPYTSAGRVTNKFGSINFAAIAKKNGTRKAYTSRFPKGKVVLIDFESYHLRLIAGMIGYKLPNEPVHEYLAKQYFETDSLSPEQYDDGKKITFSYLYSDKQEGVKYPYFKKVYQFIDDIWQIASTQGFIESISGRKLKLEHIENPTPAKLFNYLLQLRETEIAMQAIFNLRSLFDRFSSKVVLYTYDSIMIDFNLEDGKELLIETVKILEQDNKFPVRIYAGENYFNLTNITTTVKKHI